MNVKQLTRSAFPILIIAAFLINALVPGFGWMFWVVAAAIVLSGIVPAHRAVRTKRRVSDTTGVRHDPATADASVLAETEPKNAEQLAESIGLGG